MKTFKQFLLEAANSPDFDFENLDHPVHKAADEIHAAWMKRNPKGDWNAAQHVAYGELPEAEKRKDIEHVETIGRLMREISIPEGGIEQHKDAVANEFGSIQHENWRKGFDPEGTGKPRMKKVSDGKEVNINVPWKELHPEWKKENYEAGLAAYDAHKRHVGSAHY